MVRLKARSSFCETFFFCISIPVWCDWRFELHKLISDSIDFNSSMVRLKARPCPLSAPSLPHFNSSMVRLKAKTNHTDKWLLLHFNSSMVRLNVSSGALVILLSLWFQFQYGAIEGLSANRERAYLLLFQFQYGAIEGASSLYTVRVICISIPVWCDWRSWSSIFY